MIKETVTYEDFDGIETTENLYFNISSAELPNLFKGIGKILGDSDKEYSVEEISNLVSSLGTNPDPQKIVEFLTFLLSYSYGEKSEDGKRFRKTPEIQEDFRSSAAFEALVDQFVFDDNADTSRFANFLIGVMPAKMADSIKASMANGE